MAKYQVYKVWPDATKTLVGKWDDLDEAAREIYNTFNDDAQYDVRAYGEDGSEYNYWEAGQGYCWEAQ